MTMKSINPATGVLIAEYPFATSAQVEDTLRLASLAATYWKNSEFSTRSTVLLDLASRLERKKVHFANLITQEMGKRTAEAVAEIEKCAANCRFYAKHAPAMLVDQVVTQEARVCYEPMGAILAVMPWNFPFWQVFRYMAPAIMAGNVSVLKHAPNVPQCAAAIHQLFAALDTSYPLLQNLPIDVPQVEAVIADPRIHAVTLTGSDRAGRAVAAQAGAALKPCVVELGGSDPFVVLEDADVALAAKTGVISRYGNAGQACNAAKRFIVHESVYEQFLSYFVDAAAALRIGDPATMGTDLAPLARADLRTQLHEQVEDARACGAAIRLGGKVPEGAGNFYPATVIETIPKEARVYTEEVFGPVALMFKAKDEAEAVALANDTTYGLCASVWTQDRPRGERVARQIATGGVYVNGLVKSDPRLPFGGVKGSGIGRELGREGLLEFVNVKTLVVD